LPLLLIQAPILGRRDPFPTILATSPSRQLSCTGESDCSNWSARAVEAASGAVQLAKYEEVRCSVSAVVTERLC
jgi:hypothetical protein